MENNIAKLIPKEALPTPEFLEMVQRIETPLKVTKPSTTDDSDVIMVDTPAGPVPLPRAKVDGAPPFPPKPEEVKQTEPIVLEYRFSGDCRKHNIPVSTITFDYKGETVCSAYCEQCKKNVFSRVVPQLIPLFPSDVVSGDVSMTTKRRKFRKAGKEVISI